MTSKVECAIITCKHNRRFNLKYGYCESPRNVVLKFRGSIDIKGTIVFMECLNMELPGGNEDGN